MNEIMDHSVEKLDVPATGDRAPDLDVTIDGKRHEAEVVEVVQDEEDTKDR